MTQESIELSENEVLSPILPHGGRLVSRVLTGEARTNAIDRARDLPAISLNARAISDVECLATGVFSPLEGFMNRADYEGVVHEMRLKSGLLWTLPITLAAPKEEAVRLKQGGEAALLDSDGDLLGLLSVEEVFPYDKQTEACLVYGTEETRHPGVQYLYQRGELLIGGPISLIRPPSLPGFDDYYCVPAETRRRFKERGWQTIVGFQTRNPIHRSHEYIQKCALELMDGLLIHPLVGRTKLDDVPSEIRLRCYRALEERYFPKERVMLSVFPGAMRYAGPREAVFHALVRKNYGCTHFIVGRDPAGVGGYYHPYAARDLFLRLSRDELDITPLFFDEAFFCRRCDGMASAKTCPHDASERVTLSGTRVRELLRSGEPLPEEFTRPEVSEILAEWMQGG
ncbi:sulfate adenylyltransferase [Candidatus Methylomirabilis sp.]|uniref:sulfate adenylyltransferase n=1 Tax=Candidatus Methylomirabilis sp. TaxID=2032687 RepID=UPI00307657E5